MMQPRGPISPPYAFSVILARVSRRSLSFCWDVGVQVR